MLTSLTLLEANNATFQVPVDLVGGYNYSFLKVTFGANGTITPVSAVDPLPVTVSNANANGPAPSGNSSPTVLPSDQNVAAYGLGSGELVAASQTDQVLGTTGQIGDVLCCITIVPESTTPGAVSIKDGSGSSMTIFAGGAGSVSNLVPFSVNLPGWKSTSGAWKVTTGSAVHCFALGRFT